MGCIIICDHYVSQNDIFKFVYYFMILFVIYHYVDQNDILKFIYCFMILFLSSHRKKVV
jgi:hypothetical protein